MRTPVALIALAALAAACSGEDAPSNDASELFVPALDDGVQGDPATADGPALLDERDELTPEYVALVVRSGVGNMPPISRAEASDAQLQAIAAYLAAPSHGQGVTP